MAKKAAGRFFTGRVVGERLAQATADAFVRGNPIADTVRVIDPFGGDGRLIEWLIEAWSQRQYPVVRWQVSLWDVNSTSFDSIHLRLVDVCKRLSFSHRIECSIADSFAAGLTNTKPYDIVLTNPPWESLRPDRRDLACLPTQLRTKYIAQLRSYDTWLAQNYPLSQPRRKFAGWGTNLSRVGLELSLRLARPQGVVGIVMPASFLADDQTANLRRHLLTQHELLEVDYYPAEAKLFESADVESVTMCLRTSAPPSKSFSLGRYKPATGVIEQSSVNIELETLKRIDYVLPASFGTKSANVQRKLADSFPTWHDLEKSGALWAGRELDETGIARFLVPPRKHVPQFVKGRMVGRYAMLEEPQHSVIRPGWSAPPSISRKRIAWRDVSRPSQKRRMIAALVDDGWVAGNSLGIACLQDAGDVRGLLGLLGVMNSFCFEFQLRSHLATGHVSLSSLRKVALPFDQLKDHPALTELVRDALSMKDESAPLVDAYVARHVYRLSEAEYEMVLSSFEKVSDDEKTLLLDLYCIADRNLAFEGQARGCRASR